MMGPKTMEMSVAVDDRTLVGEWLARLRDPDDPVAGMNELTAARLAHALNTGRGRDMMVVSLLNPTLDADGLCAVMRAGGEPIMSEVTLFEQLRNGPLMQAVDGRDPDPKRLYNADRILDALGRTHPECLGEARGLMLLIAWLAGARDRADALIAVTPRNIYRAVVEGALMLEDRDMATAA